MNPSTLSASMVSETRRSFRKSAEKIHHCLGQLTDDQLHWRAFEAHNSIANIILHLCGNLGQWIVSGIGQSPDVRNRPTEFSDRTRYTRAQLLQRLDAMLSSVDAVLRRLEEEDPDELIAPRRIQAFDETVLSALLGTVVHFGGHTQEIICITRMLVRDKYRVYWAPVGKEQGAP